MVDPPSETGISNVTTARASPEIAETFLGAVGGLIKLCSTESHSEGHDIFQARSVA
jgi:hypothetical protein